MSHSVVRSHIKSKITVRNRTPEKMARPKTNRRFHYAFAEILLFCLIQFLNLGRAVAASDQEASTSADDKTESFSSQEARRGAREKEWYLSNVKIGGLIELPIDYVTLVIGMVSAYVLYNGLFGSSESKESCTASHILMDGHEDAIEEKMKELKKKIGDDKEAFAKAAKEYSTCPSKDKGGMLGTFRK